MQRRVQRHQTEPDAEAPGALPLAAPSRLFVGAVLVLVAGAALAACLVEVPLDDKACSATRGCATGYYCDVDTCVQGAGPGEGQERGPCRADGSCEPGLTCLADLCLRVETLDGGPLDGGAVDAGADDGGLSDAGSDAGPPLDPLAGVFGPGVVGYWSFNEGIDGGAVDYGAAGLHGTALGTTVDAGQLLGPATVIGTYFLGARFDGVDDFIEVPDDQTLDFGTDGFSVETWMRTTDPCSLEFAAVSRWTPGMLWFLSCWATDGEAAGGRAGFNVRDSENVLVPMWGETVINDGDWHHLVGVREADEIVLYVDGVADARTDVSFIGGFDGTGPLQIGRYNAADGRYATAAVDEVRLWGRALSAEEVARLFATFSPGLRGHWSFERTLRNLGGAPYPATAVGGASFVDGVQGLALQLDGVDDAAAIPDYPQTAFTVDYSISLWFRTAGSLTTDAGVQVLNNEVASRAPVNVWLQPAGLFAHIRDGADTLLEAAVPGAVDDGEWHHLVVARAGADEGMVRLNLWLDGVPSVAATGALTLTETALELRIGARSIGDPRRFAGVVDELQLYNRVLTDAEVQQLFDTNR